MSAGITARSTLAAVGGDRVRALQHAQYRAAKADPNRRFHALQDKVYREDVLWRAWLAVRANNGAPGIDKTTLAEVEQYGVARLLGELADEMPRSSSWPARFQMQALIVHASTFWGMSQTRITPDGGGVEDMVVSLCGVSRQRPARPTSGYQALTESGQAPRTLGASPRSVSVPTAASILRSRSRRTGPARRRRGN